MVDYKVDPMPEMQCQKFRIGFLLGLPIIDPTCDRYCLKALLKYQHERLYGTRLKDIELPKPANKVHDWVMFDTFTDYPLANEVLQESSDIPVTPEQWLDRLKTHGPIILSGILGNATVQHSILLVGIDTGTTPKFYFKDPLVGDAIREEAYTTMVSRIDTPIVYNKDTKALPLIKLMQDVKTPVKQAFTRPIRREDL